MQHVTIDATDPAGEMSGQTKRALSEGLGAEHLAIDHYTVDPGGEFTGGLHANVGQENLVYILDGTATYEVQPDPTANSQTVDVGPGEIIRIGPDEYQQGRNESDEPVVALTIAAPPEPDEVRVPQPCGECGDSDYLVTEFTPDGIQLVCPDCGAGFSL